jgi:hypothetical protein
LKGLAAKNAKGAEETIHKVYSLVNMKPAAYRAAQKTHVRQMPLASALWVTVGFSHS